jgi:hypothetical protein
MMNLMYIEIIVCYDDEHVNYLSNPMPTNSDGQLAPKEVVERDRTLIAIARITRNVGIVIVILALIAYCWHFGIAIDFNRIFDILDHRA